MPVMYEAMRTPNSDSDTTSVHPGRGSLVVRREIRSSSEWLRLVPDSGQVPENSHLLSSAYTGTDRRNDPAEEELLSLKSFDPRAPEAEPFCKTHPIDPEDAQFPNVFCRNAAVPAESGIPGPRFLRSFFLLTEPSVPLKL